MISSVLVHSKKFNNFLIRKYSVLKEMIRKLNNLSVKIRITENNTKKMKHEKVEISKIIINNTKILENKRERLSRLEGTYFSRVNDNSTSNQNSVKKKIRSIDEQ